MGIERMSQAWDRYLRNRSRRRPVCRAVPRWYDPPNGSGELPDTHHYAAIRMRNEIKGVRPWLLCTIRPPAPSTRTKLSPNKSTDPFAV